MIGFNSPITIATTITIMPMPHALHIVIMHQSRLCLLAEVVDLAFHDVTALWDEDAAAAGWRA